MPKIMPKVGDAITSDLYGDENPWIIEVVGDYSWSVRRKNGGPLDNVGFQQFTDGNWRFAVPPKTTAKQVGGDHYSKLGISPIDIIKANDLDFFEGNAVKYLLRYKQKNGVEDLKKAIWYIDYLIAREIEQESE